MTDIGRMLLRLSAVGSALLLAANSASALAGRHAGGPAYSGLTPLQNAASNPAAELQKLLRPHAFYGQRVTDAIRAATGDPNIVVIDRRSQWGEIYSCNYTNLRGKRALVCD